ncbi:glutathione S-transferase family protein [Neotabrizicola sp. VNH66]|uniref:glutathione S-transferase family protein n=1 Tax=Neotabrizicola sp. VNH66 TaxID=3400918 RepID=UPI003C003A7C
MLTLHSARDSSGTVVRLVAAVAGVALTTRQHTLAGPRSARLLTLNPTGSLPVLETPDGPVSETGAILLWLAEKHGLCPGPAEPGRTAFLKWLFYLSNTVHADLRQLIYPERYGPPDTEAGQVTLAAGRFLISLTHLDEAARRNPALFPPGGVLTSYMLILARWATICTEGNVRWFTLSAFPAIEALGRATEALPEMQRIAREEGLGKFAFTDPSGDC